MTKDRVHNIIEAVLTAGIIAAFGFAWNANSNSAAVEVRLTQVELQLIDIWDKYDEVLLPRVNELETRVSVLESKHEEKDANELIKLFSKHATYESGKER